MRCNWVKRVLFLADRVALVNQAVGVQQHVHAPDAKHGAKSRLGLWDYKMLRAKVAAGPEPYVVDGLLFERAQNLFVGDSTLGKTPLLASMAIAVAAGIPWMGRDTRQGPVLFLDGESTADNMSTMLDALARFAGLTEVPENLYLFGMNYDDRDERGKLVDTVKAAIAEVQPLLIIADPLRVFWHAAETKSDEAARMYAWQRSLGGTWVTMHHRRKPDAAHPISLEESPREWLLEASGTRTLINQSHTRIGIDMAKGHTSDRLALHGQIRHKGLMAAPFYIERVYDAAGDPIGYQPLTGLSHLSEEWQTAYKALPHASTYADVKKALGTKGESTVQRFLEQATNYGLLKEEGRARSKHRRYVKLSPTDHHAERAKAERIEMTMMLAEHFPGEWIDRVPGDEKPEKYKTGAAVLPFERKSA